MSTPEERAEYTMKHLVNQMCAELGYIGANGQAFLDLIKADMRIELRVFYHQLVVFYEAHPIDYSYGEPELVYD